MADVEVHSDCECMRDGSCRWLWRIIVDGLLWRAGVSMSLGDAEGEAKQSLDLFEQRCISGTALYGPGGRYTLPHKEGG